jgi:hypothetical protein
VWVWRSLRCIETKENIYIYIVANEWLGYCIAVGLILNMGKGENIWILVQALCPSLIGIVATVLPQLLCRSVTLANTTTMMLTERKKKCSVQKETNKYFLYLIIFNKFYFNIILKKKKCPPLINILAPPLVAYKGCKGMPLQYAFNKVYTAKIREKILLYGL